MSITHANPLECIVQSQRKEIATLREALTGMVEIAELTIGWIPTPEGADGPLIVARAALTTKGTV